MKAAQVQNILQSKIVNLLVFNGFWFGAVIGRDALLWLVAPLFLIYCAVMFASRTVTPLQVLLPALVGIAVDSLLTVTGVFQFGTVPGLMPLWMYLLWFNFALLIPISLQVLARHLTLAAVLGAAFAPLNYIVGERIGGVEFPYSHFTTFAVLAAVWACLMPALLVLEKHTRQAQPESCRT